MKEILISRSDLVLVIIGRTAQKKSFEICWLRIEDLVHHANSRFELVDLDVAAANEKIAVLYDLIDGIIILLELLVKLRLIKS